MASVQITWDAAPTAQQYKVYRSTTAGQQGTVIGPPTFGLAYTDSNITAGATYFYSVTAVNGAGESPASSPQQTITIPSAPPAPTNVVVTYVP